MSWRNVVSQTEASCWNTSHSDNTSETHTEQVITPFLSKLYDLLAESSNSSFVHWIHSGDCFEVFRPTEFAHQVLPNYYKHNNFSSFIRQLNQYGFRKIDKERWLFQHPCFKRGRKDLLSRIGRRKSNQKQKLANNMIERTTMSGSEEDIKSGTTTDILGDYSESPTQWKSSAKHIDSPVTKSGKDRWEWLCRELVSSKERQRRLSYIIQLDEQKVESLERQLWWMKKCMSDYVEQYSHSHSNLDTNNTTSLNKETGRLSCQGKAYLLHQGLSTKDTHMDETYLPALGELWDKEFDILPKKNVLQMDDDIFQSDVCCCMEREKEGYEISSLKKVHPISVPCQRHNTMEDVELESLSEQSTQYTACFRKWQLDNGGHVDMSSLSGSIGNSECSS